MSSGQNDQGGDGWCLSTETSEYVNRNHDGLLWIWWSISTPISCRRLFRCGVLRPTVCTERSLSYHEYGWQHEHVEPIGEQSGVFHNRALRRTHGHPTRAKSTQIDLARTVNRNHDMVMMIISIHIEGWAHYKMIITPLMEVMEPITTTLLVPLAMISFRLIRSTEETLLILYDNQTCNCWYAVTESFLILKFGITRFGQNRIRNFGVTVQYPHWSIHLSSILF